MKKRKLLTLTLLSVLTLTACGDAGTNPDVKWYNPATWDWEQANPATWDWSWLNPSTWFTKDKDQDTTEDEDVTETVPNQNVGFGNIRLNAFGADNFVTMNLTLTPVDADYGTITWTSNKSQIVVEKIGDGLSAKVYATNWLPGDKPATITVTESLSGLSATAKVYALSLPTIAAANEAPNATVRVISGQSTVHKTMADKDGTNYGAIKVDYTTDYQQATLEVYYTGSEAPQVRYKALHEGGTTRTITASSGRYPGVSGSVGKATYNIYVYKGDPSQGLMPITYDFITPTYPGGPNSTWTTAQTIGYITIATATNATSLSIGGDLTLYQ